MYARGPIFLSASSPQSSGVATGPVQRPQGIGRHGSLGVAVPAHVHVRPPPTWVLLHFGGQHFVMLTREQFSHAPGELASFIERPAPILGVNHVQTARPRRLDERYEPELAACSWITKMRWPRLDGLERAIGRPIEGTTCPAA